MEALRVFAEPKGHQLIIDLPPGLSTGRLEIIVMPAVETGAGKEGLGIASSPNLLGSAVLADDLIAPASPEQVCVAQNDRKYAGPQE